MNIAKLTKRKLKMKQFKKTQKIVQMLEDLDKDNEIPRVQKFNNSEF